MQEELQETALKLQLEQERSTQLSRRGKALEEEVRLAKAGGWQAARAAEDSAAEVLRLQTEQKELQQRLTLAQQQLAERCGSLWCCLRWCVV